MEQTRLLELAGVILTEKFDPKQVFPIAVISRSQLAEVINDTIEEKRLHISKFEENDPRLTPKFCQRFSQHMMNWHEGFQNTWLHNQNMYEQVEDFISETGLANMRTIPTKPKKKPVASVKK